VFGAAWQHDGSAKGRDKVGRGTASWSRRSWPALPFCSRPVALPVLFRLWCPAAKDSKGAKAGKGGLDGGYDGISVVDLPIWEVDVPEPAHLRRSERYAGALDIAPDEAIEAALDPRALVARDPKSRTGEAIRVVGYSAAGRVLVVVLCHTSIRRPGYGRWPRRGQRIAGCGSGMRAVGRQRSRDDDQSG
jgi:hypothetical protein